MHLQQPLRKMYREIMVGITRKNNPRMLELEINENMGRIVNHDDMFCFSEDGISDSHLFEFCTDCFTTDFNFEKECACPFLCASEFFFPFEEDVESVFDGT